MKKSMIGLAAAGLVSLSVAAQQQQPPPPQPQPPQHSPAPAKVPAPPFNTVYGDVAKVLAAKPVPESLAFLKRECRLEGTSSSVAPELPPCDPPNAPAAQSGSGERIVAYDVTYEYNGRQFSLRMPYDPGEQMPVNVDVRPPMPRPPMQQQQQPQQRPPQQQRPTGPAPQDPRYRGA
jgi:uncharacterized protein YcfJ